MYIITISVSTASVIGTEFKRQNGFQINNPYFYYYLFFLKIEYPLILIIFYIP